MPSPDFRNYVDLTLYDKTTQQIYEEAVLNLSISMSDWIPREGNVETLLLEALSLPISEAIFAINRVPNAIMQVLLLMFGVYRDIGVQPVADVRFTVMDANGYTIPAGTSVLLSIVDGINPVVFSSGVDVTVPVGSTSAVVSMTGDRYTIDANSTPFGTQMSPVDQLVFLNSATIEAVTTLGREQEDDTEWVARGSQRLSELSQALVLPRQFQAAALENASVFRALAIDSYNALPGHTPGADGGYITVAVYGYGALVSAADKAVVLAVLNSKAQANLNVGIIDAVIKPVAVTTTVVADSNANTDTVRANVLQALRSFLGYASWNWSKTVRRNDLIGVIGNAEGVAYVTLLTVPAADVVFTENAPLAVLNEANVTITVLT